jgi:lysophospholipase L1-like esterase
MSFLVISRNAADRVEARVRTSAPDLVLMPVGSYLWTVGFVAKRVRRLAGDRIGSIYKRLEDRFDAGTRRRGAVPNGMNRGARTVARRVIGASPLATQQETTAAIRRVLDMLARVEATQVAVVAYPPESPRFLRGKLRQRRESFLADVERATREHHFTWIKGDDALAEAGVQELITTPDGFHFNALGHRVHAEYALARLVAMLNASSALG